MAENSQNLKVDTVVDTSYHRPGAVSIPGGIWFNAAFLTDGEVTLLIYQRGGEEPICSINLPLQPQQGLWRSVKVYGIKASQIEYTYRVDGVLTPDPAAALLTGRDEFGVISDSPVRCRLLSASFDWQNEHGPLQIPYDEVVSYLLHVRGFTKQKGAKVRHQGTFKGIEEKIPYFKELGINQIILMPAYEFDEVMRPSTDVPVSPYRDPVEASDTYRVNYWGYGDGCYFAPKASYAAGTRPDVEFKGMVRSLHQAGIEVVMEFAFADGTDIDYMAQCLTWWTREYHVDGFVLLTNQCAAQALASCPSLRMTKLIGSHFDTTALYPKGRKIHQKNAAESNPGFRDDMRRMLKGDAGMLRSFTDRSRANERDKAIVNYITCHDGFTLMDLVSYQQKNNEANGEGGRDGSADELSWNCGAEGPTRKKSVQRLRMQQMKNAMAMLLLSQGTPMLLAGDEFGNSQGGNNNPWCQDNETTWLDWKQAKNNKELTDWVKQLIAFRMAHKVLHRSTPLTGVDQTAFGFPDFSCHSESAWYTVYEPENRHVGLMFSGIDQGKDSCVYIAYNFHWEDREFATPYLPEGMEWQVVLNSYCAAEERELPETPVRSFTVPGRTIVVLESRVGSAGIKTADETDG